MLVTVVIISTFPHCDASHSLYILVTHIRITKQRMNDYISDYGTFEKSFCLICYFFYIIIHIFYTFLRQIIVFYHGLFLYNALILKYFSYLKKSLSKVSCLPKFVFLQICIDNRIVKFFLPAKARVNH